MNGANPQPACFIRPLAARVQSLLDAGAGKSTVAARLAEREAPAFLNAWHARWDAAEEHYFTHMRPAGSFDLVLRGDAEAC